MNSNLKKPIVFALCATATVVLAGCAQTQTPSQQTTKEPASSGASGATTSGPSCNPKVGNKAPSLKIDSMSASGSASIAPGKVTLVDFWATWCKPCEKSFPRYQELYVKYKSQGFEVIAVSVDDEKNDIPGFIKKTGAKFPIGWDKGHAFADCWKPGSMPSAYIVDKKGVVRHIHNVWTEAEAKEVEAQIKALL